MTEDCVFLDLQRKEVQRQPRTFLGVIEENFIKSFLYFIYIYMYYVLYVLGKAYWKWLRESAGAVGNKVKLPPYPSPHINLPNCQIRKAAQKEVDFSLRRNN